MFVNAPKIKTDGALESVAETLRQILSAFELERDDEVNFIRLFHSGLHGFVSLENAGFFSLDVNIDESFSRLVDSQITILHSFKKAQENYGN